MNSEALLIGWLNTHAALQSPAYSDVPAGTPDDPKPDMFITVERTGGQRTPVIDYPVFAVQCWADRREDAAQLADTVAQILTTDLPLHWNIGSVDVNSTYNFPDPDSDLARYQLTVTATITP
ncbi:DUF3168 domain-containing protein [Actinobaculum sp. 352]|uniref:DUF3168 domain-containing protein n=1 Tax=Actinobaculum sp. 352 TaxID=2490946 RepID=UPI000F7E4DE3|nr:DUF3168 domain-containing protein [Actinobaculum sp. 352]RTE47732.1 DUF3168 domain-containing protein [Actinobaculum sp. 352]